MLGIATVLGGDSLPELSTATIVNVLVPFWSVCALEPGSSPLRVAAQRPVGRVDDRRRALEPLPLLRRQLAAPVAGPIPARPTTHGRLRTASPMPYSSAARTETMNIRFSSRTTARTMRATAAATP